MKLIIDIDEEMYKRICEAQSVPDMYGTDVVNAINKIKHGTPVSTELATSLQQTCNNLQQRPQGTWIFRHGVTCGGYYKCNKCGEIERAEKNFCPNCGAKMQKGGAE